LQKSSIHFLLVGSWLPPVEKHQRPKDSLLAPMRNEKTSDHSHIKKRGQSIVRIGRCSRNESRRVKFVFRRLLRTRWTPRTVFVTAGSVSRRTVTKFKCQFKGHKQNFYKYMLIWLDQILLTEQNAKIN
jgi:hypothetical protein